MRKFLFLLTSSLFVVTSLTPVFAKEGKDDPEDHDLKDRIERRIKEFEQEREDRIATRSARHKEKLDAVKLRVCETRKNIIINRSERLVKRAERQFEIFGLIATRVETFYTDKVLPRGITVPNYDDLKNTITEKKALAQTALDAASQSAESLDCSGTDPKGQIQNFKDDFRAGVKALKSYRRSIRDLIVGVKSAIGKAEKEATSSAESSN
ncbi:MAG: hypothetical protein Q8P13_04700 [bacterium]|nr:hypothetical protein [bacterium]